MINKYPYWYFRGIAANTPLKEFINIQKELYIQFLPVFCPYLGTNVIFTMSGFNHLIWKKGMGRRQSSIIISRLSSLQHVQQIISKSGTLQEYEEVGNSQEFLCFIAIIDRQKYKVVIFRTMENIYKFVSIIPKWKTGIRDQVKKPSLE